MRRPTICAQDGCTTTTLATRCTQHQLTYPHSERQRMAAAVAAHRREHGNWCPGYKRPAHHTEDLTADHTTRRVNGGNGGPLTVLCRSCNSARG